MSEIMRPMPFAKLMNWAVCEHTQQKRVFGVRAEKFYKNQKDTSIEIFGQHLASPIGPAAGPNSQLAQNIVAAYLTGSRFIELKTVQKMDGAELRACVPRPCINAQDEGYNVEWSTELTIPQAFEEYVKAWLAIHVLAKEYGIASKPDFAFNMSVGYDLEGIQSSKIDDYIEGMKDASNAPVYKNGIAWLQQNLQSFQNFTSSDIAAISPNISNSVTLSTLHGCPPQEIERIAKYLLKEKKVHTFVKCNPTLLGYETARRLLDEMGYDYITFDEHHFQNDLQYPDAVAMLTRLVAFAKEHTLLFGVKITNTFPVQIKKFELPGEEMYMSGRALFPLSINVASKLAQDFDGKLPISYSGGADAFNILEIFKTGIQPITVATTILKPGGYERLKQLAEQLEPLMLPEWPGVDVKALKELADNVTSNTFYHKEQRTVASRKTDSTLPLLDCFKAPCKDGGCPIEQQIPEYLRLVSEGKYAQAFAVIAVDNATPSITGTICNHACQGKCTRLDYDESLHIRGAKLLAAQDAQEAYTNAIVPSPLATQKKAVVIGAGPAGVSAALFLRRAGVAVTVLEKRDKPFGIVEYVIPAFRIPAQALQRDFDMAKKIGVEFQFGVANADVPALRIAYDYVILATGAWGEGSSPVEEGGHHLVDALAFLAESKAKDCKVALGKHVAVIGGGDVAMDCARAAKRAPGTESVTLVYRRTKDFMPAEPEEIRLAIQDGVQITELRAPVRYDGSCLCCEEMELGEWDESGRRGVNGTGTEHKFDFDTVICAVGARVDTDIFKAAGIHIDKRGRPVLNENNESSIKGTYVAGDCKAGPSTVVSAIADGKAIAKGILSSLGLADGFVRTPVPLPVDTLYDRKGILRKANDENTDGSRCLACDQLCELCCDVCPNRANVRVQVPGLANSAQILHVDGLCNECGNCGIFCPHAGNPYKDKWTVFWSQEDFTDSENKGFLKIDENQYMIRMEENEKAEIFTCTLQDEKLPRPLANFIQTVVDQYSYYL